MGGLVYFCITYWCPMWYLKPKYAGLFIKLLWNLYLLFIIWSSENTVSQRYVDAKNINMSKAAF